MADKEVVAAVPGSFVATSIGRTPLLQQVSHLSLPCRRASNLKLIARLCIHEIDIILAHDAETLHRKHQDVDPTFHNLTSPPALRASFNAEDFPSLHTSLTLLIWRNGRR
jgi:hypothetical protein